MKSCCEVEVEDALPIPQVSSMQAQLTTYKICCSSNNFVHSCGLASNWLMHCSTCNSSIQGCCDFTHICWETAPCV